MSEQMGSRPTGRKPESVRRQSSRTTGAFGKEKNEQVVTGNANRNTDRDARNSCTSHAVGGNCKRRTLYWRPFPSGPLRTVA
jgi:hypothetical protein